jgi:hypothetical protein
VTGWVKRAEFDAALAGALDENSEPDEPEAPDPPRREKPSPHKDYAAVKGKPARTRRRPDDVDVPF